jgi:transposase
MKNVTGKPWIHSVGVTPSFQGVLCHDHWKPYYLYDCLHSLCNAHHLRELERAFEQDQQQWAKAMQTCLLDINAAIDDRGGALNVEDAKRWREHYRKLLADAEHECPPPVPTPNKRGPVKRSKARNLLKRLVNYEVDVLRFMTDEGIPFTNNQGENDLRMTKVQQKYRAVSGRWMVRKHSAEFAVTYQLAENKGSQRARHCHTCSTAKTLPLCAKCAWRLY